ncbi:hypothetical protein E6W39_14075 [Kitasatospora acidiphila]|uniref:Uncharacterized protein n=1 Tax=Kitasatospora acidiphila TaxID=2567942 RepID=A0A540W2C2_9ACTN|nr:hypothetical protein [Kitasatospora acidiphila]TQF03166.1 hypothetical protein E6W39_14075 [Kitasatospora acidiphila]
MIGTAALAFADPREAADLGAFLTRLLRFDRAAAVRLLAVPGPRPAESAQSAESEQPGAPGGAVEDGGVLAVYGRLPLGGTGVLALRTARLTGPAPAADATVSAGQLLEAVDEERGALVVPPPVTGPAWAGMLPPRTGWQLLGSTEVDLVMPQLMESVREFKERTAEVPEHHRSRAVLDQIADDIWSRPLAALPELPLRVAHAAYRIGFLHPGAALTAHRAKGWLRLTAPHGTVALRTAGPGAGLGLTPLG